MPDDSARVRRKLTGVLFSGVGLTSTGFIAAITVAGLAAEDLTGTSSLAGVPAAASTIGTALGSMILASATVRLGRRPMLIGAYLVAGSASALAALAVGSTSFALLIFAMFSLGFGNSASHLTRYAAADLHQPSRRTAAIGWIVWAGTIGSVAGPNLLRYSADLAERSGLAPFAGPYLLAAIAFWAAALFYVAFLRPDPLRMAVSLDEERPLTSLSLSTLVRRPRVQVAIASMVTSHFVMVLIMSMTPIFLRNGGSGLEIVGFVISAHTLGMFALSPITGVLGDRYGRPQVAAAGMAIVLASVALAGTAPADATVILVIALFLLGLGWNFAFIGGSAILTEGLAIDERLRLQGAVDASVWLSGAAASLSSGIILAVAGFPFLNALGAALLVIPVAVFIRHHSVFRKPSAATLR
ncbi:MAG: MFS transporter [Acidimicrobiia bacterium]|nr:MFS transporter [Acidimicrobiia bacterium]